MKAIAVNLLRPEANACHPQALACGLERITPVKLNAAKDLCISFVHFFGACSVPDGTGRGGESGAPITIEWEIRTQSVEPC